jgi:hypothetical protein
MISSEHEVYSNPLITRYASKAMTQLWGEQRKIGIWRRLWLYLAESQRELGLNISEAQLDEMRRHLDQIDFARAAQYERDLRHDVMAHVHAFGDDCPAARPIIHLGATSCYVTDNADLILIRESLHLIAHGLPRSSMRWARLRRATPNWRVWHLLICNRPSQRRSASEPAYGIMISSWTFSTSSDWLQTWRRVGPRGRPERRRVSCSFSTTITARSKPDQMVASKWA